MWQAYCKRKYIVDGLLVGLLLLWLPACGTLSIPQEKQLGEEFAREDAQRAAFHSR